MIKNHANYYFLADDDEPYRTSNNKNYLGKVMFLVAVAIPRFDDEGKETYSEKIGVFPLVQQVATKRSNVNRLSGTLETKLIASMIIEVTHWFYINKVLPDLLSDNFTLCNFNSSHHFIIASLMAFVYPLVTVTPIACC